MRLDNKGNYIQRGQQQRRKMKTKKIPKISHLCPRSRGRWVGGLLHKMWLKALLGKSANFPERLLMKTPSMLCWTILYKKAAEAIIKDTELSLGQ